MSKAQAAPVKGDSPRTTVAPLPLSPMSDLQAPGISPECRICGETMTSKGYRPLKDLGMIRIRYQCGKDHSPVVNEVNVKRTAPVSIPPAVNLHVRGAGPKCRVCGEITTNEGVRQVRNPALVKIRYECKRHHPPIVYELIVSRSSLEQGPVKL